MLMGRLTVAFHCYEGSVGQQQEFTSKFPKAEVYHTGARALLMYDDRQAYMCGTECTGTIGSDWWSDIKVSHHVTRMSYAD
jgi:hypothetical protein